jgi:hypothetical protein
MVKTESDVALQGAETKDTCTEGGSTHVLVSLDRRLFAADLRRSVEAREPRLRELTARAAQLLLEKRPLDAASRLSEAAVIADALEVDARLVRLVGKDPAFIVAEPSGNELRGRALEAVGQTTLLVRVLPADGTQTLQRLAVNCVSSTGIGVVAREEASAGVLAFDVQTETPNLAMGTFYMVRATMTATLEPKAGSPIRSGAAVEVKGGGATPENAVRDALRRFGSDKVCGLVDELFAAGGWTLKRRVPAK